VKHLKPAFEINICARCFCSGVATLFFGTDVSEDAHLILLNFFFDESNMLGKRALREIH
jgi:hypothetical protein